MSQLHDDIDALIERVPYGKLFINLSTNAGKVTSMHATYMVSEGKYDSNILARYDIDKVIDMIQKEEKDGGAVTITLHPRKGIVSQITTQASDRITFKY